MAEQITMTMEELRAAHKHSSIHREEILASEICGCFYCCKTFSPQLIRKWVDGEDTALCPLCGIDSVVGSASGLAVDDSKWLDAMGDYWFSEDEPPIHSGDNSSVQSAEVAKEKETL